MADAPLQAFPVELERVAREQPAGVGGVEPRAAGEAVHAALELHVPVTVVERHAAQPVRALAQGRLQLLGRRVVGLDGEEDLAPLQVVPRVARERGVLVAEGRQLLLAALALGGLEESADQLRGGLGHSGPAPALLARELDQELGRRGLDAGVEVPDPLLPVFVECVEEVRDPAGAGLEEAEAQPGEGLEHAVEDQLGQRHLLQAAVREDVGQREALHQVRVSGGEAHAGSSVDSDGHVQPLRFLVEGEEVRVGQGLGHANRGEGRVRFGVGLRQMRCHADPVHAELQNAAAQLVHGFRRVLQGDHADRMQTTVEARAILGDVVVVGAAQDDGQLRIHERIEGQRDRPVEHLVVDSLAIHVFEAHPVEEPADRALLVIWAIGPFSEALGLEEGPRQIVRAGGGVSVEDAETLLAVAVAHEGDSLPVGLRDEIGEDQWVLALVAVRVDDRVIELHHALRVMTVLSPEPVVA